MLNTLLVFCWKDTLKRDLTIFCENHEINVEYSLQQPNIIQLTSSTSSPSNSCLMTAVIAFSYNWDSFFRTYRTTDPAALTLHIFPIWLKTKTNQRNYLFLSKILSFFANLSSSWYYPKQQKPFKAKHTIFNQILGWIFWRFIANWDRFWLRFFTKYPLKLSYK